jgi:hypothetical protein
MGRETFFSGELLGLLLTLQQDPYFAGATWTHLSPGFEAQSTYLRHSILNSLPTSELDQFLHQLEFKNDGFKMFSRLIDRLQPAANESKLTNILALASLTFEPQDTTDSFMLRARTCFNSLKDIPVESLIPLLVLCRIDKDKFPGIRRNLLAF